MFTFEEKLDEINELLKKSSSQWKLDGIAWMDFNDISQIIRIHIYNKWHLWDQQKPLAPWCKQVISNQIRNLIRNNYSSFCRPCMNCPYNGGENSCSFTKSQKQDNSCSDYKKWFKKKANLYNIKMPMSLDNQVVETVTYENKELDFLRSAEKLHQLMLIEIKNERHRQIYAMIYIDGAEDSEVAKEMGFSPDDKSDSRFKQIHNLKKKFLQMAKILMEKHDIIVL